MREAGGNTKEEKPDRTAALQGLDQRVEKGGSLRDTRQK